MHDCGPAARAGADGGGGMKSQEFMALAAELLPDPEQRGRMLQLARKPVTLPLYLQRAVDGHANVTPQERRHAEIKFWAAHYIARGMQVVPLAHGTKGVYAED